MSIRYESPTIRNAVAFLGLIGVVSVLGMIGLALEKVEIPTALATAAGAAIGSIGTLLTTFTPSPVPGGRRAQDAPSVVTEPADVVSTLEPAAGNVPTQVTTAREANHNG